MSLCVYHVFALQFGRTALHLSVANGKVEMIEYLVEKGININQVDDVSYTLYVLLTKEI